MKYIYYIYTLGDKGDVISIGTSDQGNQMKNKKKSGKVSVYEKCKSNKLIKKCLTCIIILINWLQCS